jgi:iron complex outermembrane receptor protein
MKFELMHEIRSVGLALAVIGGLVQPAYANKQTKEISGVENKEHYSTIAAQLLAQNRNAAATKITGIKVNTTDKGIEVILESPNIEALKPVNKSQGSNFIVEIPNTVLSLGKQNSFNKKNPVAGIANVSITQTNANTVQLTITGEKGIPTAELFDGDEGLIFEVIPFASATASPQQNQTVVEISEVKFNTTSNGLEIILATPEGDKLQVSASKEGNTFIVDIPSAQLSLPNGDTVSQKQPIAGVSDITVSNFNANTIRVTVTGTDNTPTVELFDSDEGLIFGVAATASTPQAETPTTQPETEPTPTPQSENQTQPEQPTVQSNEPIELIITGEQDRYRVIDATTATRTDTALRDTPQSIQVVPEQVLKDQQAIRLNDAVRNVSGVNTGDTFGGTKDNFVIRGFSSSFGGNILINGLGSNGFDTGFNETANLERVEVLKGPASVLYGNLEPGGVINLVTKKPLFQPFYSAEFQVGNNSFYRGAIDISSPLNVEKTASYRLNAAYENSGTFRNFDQRIERTFLAPVVSLQLGKQTDLTLEFSYLNDERPFDRGLIAIGNKIVDVPYNRIFGEPDDVSKVEEISASYLLEHRFNENLKLRNTFRFLSTDTFNYRADQLGLDEETGEVIRNFRSNDDIARKYAFQTDLTSKFKTGSIAHTLLFGVDFANRTSEGTQKRLPAGLTPSINIFNPIYNQIARPSLSELTNVVRDSKDTSSSLGLFLQDQISLTDNFKLVVGGRFDFVDQESRFNGETSNQYDTAFTPRVGLVYQPIKPISLYASYSQSFQPNFATRANGSFLDPERGTQYEAGIRGEFLDSKLVTNLAIYQITKSNVATTDPDNPDFSIAVGEQKSTGIELDVTGQILPGWNIIASYAYTDAKVTADNDGLKGNRLANVPYSSASLWTTYEFQKGGLQGLGLGLGAFFVGDRQGDLGNTFQLPSYVRTDAAIFYRRNNWQAALNFKNLFDINYIRSAEYREAIAPGDPFTVVGSIGVEF